MKQKSRHLRTMARYLDVSDRTVYRYFELFKALGYKVNKDSSNKYYLNGMHRENKRIDSEGQPGHKR